jgi:hypothetical protein
MIRWDRRDFRRLFPSLSEPLERSEVAEDEVKARPKEPLSGFMPGPEDYLARCRTDEEAVEVINFLHRRGEISREVFEKLSRRIAEDGVRSFGPLREDGYYLRFYGGRGRR